MTNRIGRSRVLSALVLCVLSSASVACSVFTEPGLTESGTSAEGEQALHGNGVAELVDGEGGAPAQEPFLVEVQKVVNDGSTLGVFARIEPRTRVPINDVAVVLRGLAAGKVIASTSAPLSEVVDKTQISSLAGMLVPPAQVVAYLRIPVGGVSDFQFQALWGEDARASLREYWREPSNAVGLESISLQEVPCSSQARCTVEQAIAATVRNKSPFDLCAATLIVSPQAPSLDLEGHNQQTPATIRLNPLRVGPGMSRAIRVVLGASSHLQVVPTLHVSEIVSGDCSRG